ncbi:LuxR C-terminal-related transcriptional regulator [Microbacterium sp. NPDC089696]|uniref:helix-turn-helix transcriptional regulator n=1 Tax=Microbacterium sp. NPDC089696 TaxID=3364199 RepID=UPI00382AA8C9
MSDAPAVPVSAPSLDALDRAVAAQDWAAATDAVRAGWFELVTPEVRDRTHALLDRVPAAAMRREPLLAMEFGILLNQTRFQRLRALRYFVMAVRAARSSRSTDLRLADRFLIRASESAALRLLGRTGLSVSAARGAMELAHALDDDDRAEITELPRIFAVLGMSFHYGGHPDEAVHAAELGLAEASPTPPSSGMSPLALLCGVHTLRGDLPTAREHLEYARSGPWTDRQRNGYSGVFYRVAEAIVALERFDPDAAREQIEQLWAMTVGRHSNEHWTTIVETQALIEIMAGHPGRGLAVIDDMVALRGGEGSQRARARLARIRSLLQLALGNPDGASAVLARDAPEAVTAHIERARIALSLGQTGTALSELRAVDALHPSTRQTAEAAAIDAAVLLRLSPTPRRDGVVQRLGSLLDRSGQRLALALLPPSDLDRVVAALEEGGFVHVVEDVPIRSLLRDVEPGGLLSRRELAVLEQLQRTGSIAEIAAVLVVSSNTVKSQIRSIYRKLGVSSREDAIAVTIELHLLAAAVEDAAG